MTVASLEMSDEPYIITSIRNFGDNSIHLLPFFTFRLPLIVGSKRTSPTAIVGLQCLCNERCSTFFTLPFYLKFSRWHDVMN